MRLVRELIKRALLRRDTILSRPPGQFELPNLKLAKARDRGLRVNFAVDGGAAEGRWAAELKAIYPAARVLCVEPRADAQPALRARAARLDGVVVAQTLLGAAEGNVAFYQHPSHGDQSSVLPAAGRAGAVSPVAAPMTTLDRLVAKLGLPDPDLIKLDLQGYELECLKGASRCLAHAEAVLLEVSFIEIYRGMPLIGAVVPFMSERGFRVYDVPSLWHRPLDGALAQGDFLFVAERSQLLSDARWSAAE